MPRRASPPAVLTAPATRTAASRASRRSPRSAITRSTRDRAHSAERVGQRLAGAVVVRVAGSGDEPDRAGPGPLRRSRPRTPADRRRRAAPGSRPSRRTPAIANSGIRHLVEAAGQQPVHRRAELVGAVDDEIARLAPRREHARATSPACVRCSITLRTPPTRPSATIDARRPRRWTRAVGERRRGRAPTSSTKNGNTMRAVARFERLPGEVVEGDADDERRATDEREPARRRLRAQVELEVAAVDARREHPEHRAAGSSDQEEQPAFLLVAAGEPEERLADRQPGQHRIAPRRAGVRALREEGRQPRHEREHADADRGDAPAARPALRSASRHATTSSASADDADEVERPVLRVDEQRGHAARRGASRPNVGRSSARWHGDDAARDEQHLEHVHARFGGVPDRERVGRHHDDREPRRRRAEPIAAPRTSIATTAPTPNTRRERARRDVAGPEDAGPDVEQHVVERRRAVALAARRAGRRAATARC